MSLKDINKVPLFLVLIANVAIFFAIAKSGDFVVGDWSAAVRDWTQALPAGLGAVLAGIANALLDSTTKARLVFWRWRHPLPACRAFSELGPADARVDMAILEQSLAPLPTDPLSQNRLWYRLFKSVGDLPEVAQVHREYLFTRDYACIALLILVLFGAAAFFQMPLRTASVYVAALMAQYLVVRWAARNHGVRFVTTVLALKGAGK